MATTNTVLHPIPCNPVSKNRHEISCEHCGAKRLYVHQYYTRCLEDSVIRGHVYYLSIKMRSFLCRHCKRTFNETLDEGD